MRRVKLGPTPVDKFVGSRIRMRRLFLKMSMDELAKTLRLTYQQVQKYEKGINRVSAGRLLEIGSALDVSPAFFFERTPASTATPAMAMAPSPDFASDFLATAEGLELVRAFVMIKNPKLRLSLVRLAQEMSKNN